MKDKRLKLASPSEAEVAARSLSGLSLENLEDRVENLRRASEPTRKARAATNKASRDATGAKLKAKKGKAEKP